MTINQLAYFVSVAEELNLTRVSEQFHISQPAVSAAIRDLEKEFNICLFERSRNKLSLTPLGMATYKRAKKLLEHYDAFCDSLTASDAFAKRLTIAIAPNVAAVHLPKLLPYLTEKMSDTSITMEEDSIANMTRNLKSGLIDVAVFACYDGRRDSELQYRRFSTFSIALCVSPELLDLPTDRIEARDLIGISLAMQYKASILNDKILEWFSAGDVVPNIIFYANQIMSILALVRNGMAAGFLPPELVESEENIIAYKIDEIGTDLPIYVVYKHETDLIKEMIKALNCF